MIGVGKLSKKVVLSIYCWGILKIQYRFKYSTPTSVKAMVMTIAAMMEGQALPRTISEP